MHCGRNHVVARGKSRKFLPRCCDISFGSYPYEASVDAIGLQQCLYEVCRAFAVAGLTRQHFGCGSRPMAVFAMLDGEVAYVVAYPCGGAVYQCYIIVGFGAQFRGECCQVCAVFFVLIYE